MTNPVRCAALIAACIAAYIGPGGTAFAAAVALPVPPEAIVHREGCNAASLPPNPPPAMIALLGQSGGACTTTDNVVRIPLAWPGDYRVTVWHEYGHVFDNVYMTGASRRRLKPWMRGGGRPGLAWENEYFADLYGNCARGQTFHGFDSYYGFAPRSRHAYRKSCRIIRSVAQRRGLLPTS